MKTSLPKLFFLVWMCIFVSCATRSGKVMTMDSYLEVNTGETREELIQKFGEPASIEVNTDGTEIFTYSERLTMNGHVMKFTTYYFILKDGKVVQKSAKVEDRPQTINSDQM